MSIIEKKIEKFKIKTNKKAMSHYIIDKDWLTIKMRKALRHKECDIILLNLFRSVIFKQMLEPPIWDGTYTIIEGRYIIGTEVRLHSLDVFPLCEVVKSK